MAAGRSSRVETAVVVPGAFRPPAERRSLLDRAHRGDIEGALGSVRAEDTGPRRSLAHRLGTLLAIAGPGVVVMVADNEAGSLSVYGQAGQDYGLGLLWLVFLLAPVLFVNQEMVARLGAVTGAGHARLILERFGRRWGMFALGDLLALSLLTLVTELIGVDLALGYFGVSRYVSVPLAAAALLVATGGGSFRRWERTMYLLIGLNLLVVPLVLLSHPRPGAVAHALVPSIGGELNPSGVLFVIALVGATVTPWQLFFHQSNVVDKRITSRWLAYERIDTLLGTAVFTLGAVAVIVACAFAFDGTAAHGAFVDAGALTRGLAARLGPAAGAVFALVLLNGSVLGGVVMTLGTSYAIGDVYGVRHSLHRRWREARFFYGSFALLVLVAVVIVLIPATPLGIVTTAVQALAGVLLPSATVFLLLLCNDRAVLGPWVNGRLLNAVASLIVGILLVLSALLMWTTLFPHARVEPVGLVLAAALAAGLGFLAFTSSWRRRPGRRDDGQLAPESWTMPPFESLPPPARSRTRLLGLVVLRLYLTAAVALLAVKAIELMAR